MSKTEIAEKTIADNGGIAKTAELLSAGLSKSDIGRLTDSGVIVRIRHGFYRLRSGKHLSLIHISAPSMHRDGPAGRNSTFGGRRLTKVLLRYFRRK